ncbi:MAG: hypothetical protein LBD13_04215, partial [Spirochaetaceae bacterium]|nr:hypothetical protein [Spirochaetaceae bacterium]
LDGATLTLGETAILGLPATGTAVGINVGATAEKKFTIRGASSASTLAAGADGTGTVSFQGLAAGSKILGSATTATLAGAGDDLTIAVGANSVVIERVEINLTSNGAITIANSGVLTLNGAAATIKLGAETTAMGGNANRKIPNATIGANLIIWASADGTGGSDGDGVDIGKIIGADSANTLTGTGAITLNAATVNA